MNTITVKVNGETFTETVPARLLLVDFLRERLALTGTHVGCTYEGVRRVHHPSRRRGGKKLPHAGGASRWPRHHHGRRVGK